MFLPLGDAPNPPGRPWLTWVFIGINVAVFLLVSLPAIHSAVDLKDPHLLDYLRSIGARGRIPAQAISDQVTAYDLFLYRYGFRPSAPSVVGLVSAMFLHGGWMHLCGNMLFLWIFGDNVEYRLGRLNYLLAYLGTGICSSLFFSFFVRGPEVTLIGASGAISGVLGLYYFWFPRNRIRTFVFLFPFVMSTYMIPARFVLGFYLLVDNLLPFLFDSGNSGGVAHGAHIGGFLAGLALAFVMEKAAGMGGAAEPNEKRGEGGSGGRAQGDVIQALKRGDLALAARFYFLLPDSKARSAVDSRDLITLGDFLLRSGQGGQALSVFRKFIAERPSDPLYDRACLGAGKAMFGLERQATSAFQYFLAALDATGNPEVAEEARLSLRAIERLGKPRKKES